MTVSGACRLSRLDAQTSGVLPVAVAPHGSGPLVLAWSDGAKWALCASSAVEIVESLRGGNPIAL